MKEKINIGFNSIEYFKDDDGWTSELYEDSIHGYALCGTFKATTMVKAIKKAVDCLDELEDYIESTINGFNMSSSEAEEIIERLIN